MPPSRTPERTPPSRLWVGFCALLAGALAAPAGPAAGEPRHGPDDPWTLCARHAAAAETRESLPPHLLSAIAKVESGRWLEAEGSVHAWPWTVTAGGKGRFYPTMDAAVEAAEALRAAGRRNIDVGCMQVNLLHHPDAFEDLRAALDPASNVAYAAGLLRRLQREARSWPRAVAYYHSRTASLNAPYRRKVFRAWHEEWRLAGTPVPASPAAAAADAAPPGDTGATAGGGTEVMAGGGTDVVIGGGAAAGPEESDPYAILASFTLEDGKEAPDLGQVQLGAFRVPENARTVWERVLEDNAALLGDLQPRVDVVDRGEAGTLHLLRVSPIMNARLARSICSELRHREVDCLVIEPPPRFALHRFGGPVH